MPIYLANAIPLDVLIFIHNEIYDNLVLKVVNQLK